jgi:hypothetical protein
MESGTIIGLSVLAFLTIAGLIIWWYITKNQYRYRFKVISRDGKSVRTTKAKLVRDPDNSRINRFSFKENPVLLEVREPDAHEDGHPIRRLTFNVEGKYVYLQGYKVNEDEYLQASLKPEAKELALYQFQANQRRNPLVDKTQMAMLVSGVILFLLIMGMTIFVTVKFLKAADTVVEITRSLQQSVDGMNSYADVLLESNKIFLGATNNIAGYCGVLNNVDFGVLNITRSLPPQSTS